jgi:hypothetical protein
VNLAPFAFLLAPNDFSQVLDAHQAETVSRYGLMVSNSLASRPRVSAIS